MPVPLPVEESSPRRLLRDVVFDKMVAAIMVGTLEPGERLNDDELVKWLGVSRTPIREAIARLNAWGLVEMEANRYTRIAKKDPEAFAEASAFLAGLHDLAAQWPGATAPKDLGKAVKSASAKISNQDVDGTLELLDAYGAMVEATGNALFIETELPLRTRVKFLSPDDPADYDWAAIGKRAAALAH